MWLKHHTHAMYGEDDSKFSPIHTCEINHKSMHDMQLLSEAVVAKHKAKTPVSYTQQKNVANAGSGPLKCNSGCRSVWFFNVV